MGWRIKIESAVRAETMVWRTIHFPTPELTPGQPCRSFKGRFKGSWWDYSFPEYLHSPIMILYLMPVSQYLFHAQPVAKMFQI